MRITEPSKKRYKASIEKTRDPFHSGQRDNNVDTSVISYVIEHIAYDRVGFLAGKYPSGVGDGTGITIVSHLVHKSDMLAASQAIPSHK